jgi:hypothetical protein
VVVWCGVERLIYVIKQVHDMMARAGSESTFIYGPTVCRLYCQCICTYMFIVMRSEAFSIE